LVFEKPAEQKQSQRIVSESTESVEGAKIDGEYLRGENASKPHSRYNCIFEFQTELYALSLGSLPLAGNIFHSLQRIEIFRTF